MVDKTTTRHVVDFSQICRELGREPTIGTIPRMLPASNSAKMTAFRISNARKDAEAQIAKRKIPEAQ